MRSGITSIQVTTLNKARVRVDPFVPLGGLSEVRAVVTKTIQGSSARVAFVVTDGVGQQASCT